MPAAPSTATLVAFLGYLALVVAIGVYATRFSSAGISEFFLGGRRMHRFVVALSAVVSGRSAWLLLGVTGLAWSRGISAVWAVVGYIVAELLLFLFYARRLRRFSGAYDCLTLPDFFAVRFGDQQFFVAATISPAEAAGKRPIRNQEVLDPVGQVETVQFGQA